MDEETTQVGGGKGLPVCLCKRSHEGERVTGELSHNTLATTTEYNGTWLTIKKKPLCVYRTMRAFVVNGVLRFRVRFELVRVGVLPILGGLRKQYFSFGETVLKQ